MLMVCALSIHIPCSVEAFTSSWLPSEVKALLNARRAHVAVSHEAKPSKGKSGDRKTSEKGRVSYSRLSIPTPICTTEINRTNKKSMSVGGPYSTRVYEWTSRCGVRAV